MARHFLVKQGDDGTDVRSAFNSREEALAQAAEDYCYGTRKHRVEDAKGNVVHDSKAVHEHGQRRHRELKAELAAIRAGKPLRVVK